MTLKLRASYLHQRRKHRMPKIEFSREVTKEQYDLLQAVLKLNEQTFDQWMWENITASVEGDLENADRSPLAYK